MLNQICYSKIRFVETYFQCQKGWQITFSQLVVLIVDAGMGGSSNNYSM